MVLNGAYYGSRGSRSGQIFEVLGGLVTYSSYQVEATTKIKLYRHLVPYPRKVFSTGGTVSTIPCSQRRLLRLPGVAIWADFRGSGRAGDIQFLQSRGKYQDKIISSPWSIPTQRIQRLDRGLEYFLALNGAYYVSRGSRSIMRKYHGMSYLLGIFVTVAF